MLSDSFPFLGMRCAHMTAVLIAWLSAEGAFHEDEGFRHPFTGAGGQIIAALPHMPTGHACSGHPPAEPGDDLSRPGGARRGFGLTCRVALRPSRRHPLLAGRRMYYSDFTYCATSATSALLRPSACFALYFATTSSSVAAEPLWKYGGCCHTPFNGAVRYCLVAVRDA